MKTQTPRFVRLAVIVCLGVAGAAGGRAMMRGAPPQAGPTDICALIPGAGTPTEVVALGERVDPANAPYPFNDSERLLFRQVYEALVHVDCELRVTPGLAASWRFDAGESAWIMTLRENARFSDGAPVTPADVISAWTLGNAGTDLRPEVRRLVRSVTAIDDRTLAIVMENPGDNALLALAHTDLSVTKRAPGTPWPLGTRRAKILETGSSAITVARLPANLTESDSENSFPSIRFLMAPGRDARDLLDQGADLIVTRDPTALDYAATLPGFVSMPLPWRRTYALIAPGRSRGARSLSVEERDLLAHDAIRGEAQGTREPFWWQSPAGCDTAAPQPAATSVALTPRVVYDSSDIVARDLAERLVGLGRASGPGATAILDALLPDRSNRSFQRAAGLGGAALAAARRSGTDAAYIVALERRPLDPCREITVMIEAMRWMDPETIVPLADTRMRAIVRRGRSGVVTEWDGGLLLVDPGQ